VSPPKRAGAEPGLWDLGRLTLDSEATRSMREKVNEPLYGVVVRLGVRAGSKVRANSLRRRLLGSLQVVRTPGAGFERRLLWSRSVARRIQRLQQPIIAWPCILNADELASCLCFPVGNPMLPGLSYRGHRQLPPAVGG
jgi:hypothetical protein